MSTNKFHRKPSTEAFLRKCPMKVPTKHIHRQFAKNKSTYFHSKLPRKQSTYNVQRTFQQTMYQDTNPQTKSSDNIRRHIQQTYPKETCHRQSPHNISKTTIQPKMSNEECQTNSTEQRHLPYKNSNDTFQRNIPQNMSRHTSTENVQSQKPTERFHRNPIRHSKYLMKSMTQGSEQSPAYKSLCYTVQRLNNLAKKLWSHPGETLRNDTCPTLWGLCVLPGKCVVCSLFVFLDCFQAFLANCLEKPPFYMGLYLSLCSIAAGECNSQPCFGASSMSSMYIFVYIYACVNGV